MPREAAPRFGRAVDRLVDDSASQAKFKCGAPTLILAKKKAATGATRLNIG